MFKTSFELKITGLNLHHVLSFFEREHFCVKKLERINHKTLTCRLFKKDFNKFKKSDLFPHYIVEVINTYGLKKIFNNLVHNFGLFIGITICLFSTLNLSSKVYSVNINTNEHICNHLY